MAIVGRILGIAGSVWIALGLFGHLINVPNVNPLPGIVLLFVAGVLRKQSSANRGTQDEDGQAMPVRAPTTRRAPRPDPTPPSKTGVSKPAPSASQRVVKPVAMGEGEKMVTMDDEHLAGETSPDRDTMALPYDEEADSYHSGQALSSSEMIAQARRRWNRRP